MSRVPGIAILVLFAACSSSPTTGSPPPASTPASVTVMAGNGQQAAPGAAVPVNPAVIVKNAAGSPVAGATVTFTVDSGGGTITGGTATTNANGVATLGGWNLGPTQGRNILRVSVSGLSPMFVSATGVPGLATRIADTTIGAGGGTITSNTAPLAGLALAIPAGAFAGSGHWTVDYQPPPVALLNANYRIASPIISITTDQGMADQLMTLKIPVTRRSDSIAAAFYYDSTTGYIEPLPTIAIDANSITVGTRHFSAALLAERSNVPGSLRSRILPFGSLRLGSGGLSVSGGSLPAVRRGGVSAHRI